MIDSLLYVSRPALRSDSDGSEIQDILAVARPRNQSLGVTGALIFTNDNFAQLLEGPADAIDQLMTSIRQDPRHKDVRTVREEKDVTRRFDGWHMAYNGSSLFVARHVRVLAATFDAPSEAHAARLMDLMTSLSRGDTGDLPI
jgi:hypothetical protein